MSESKSLQNSGGGLCSGIAVLSTKMCTQEDGWRQLLPAGHFKAKDGRPTEPAISEKGWFIDEAIANKLIAKVAALKQDVVVDYEHQTIFSTQNGLPAPASGWFNDVEMKWIDAGLFVRPRWTSAANAMLKNNEYRFLSAVFSYNEITGHPTELLNIALTNDPALTGMQELTKIAVLKFSPQSIEKQENKMDKLLVSLLTALGITVENDDVESAVKSALDSISQLNTAKETAETAVATLKANSATAVDLREYVPIATYNALRENVATLKAENDGLSIDQLIDAGRKDGRVLISEVDYFKNLGAQAGVAVLKSTIDGRSPIAALTSTQTKATAAQPVAKLTADQQTAAALLGKTDDEFLAILKKEGI